MTDRRRPSSWRRPSRFYFFFFFRKRRSWLFYVRRATRPHSIHPACITRTSGPFFQEYTLFVCVLPDRKEIFFFVVKPTLARLTLDRANQFRVLAMALIEKNNDCPKFNALWTHSTRKENLAEASSRAWKRFFLKRFFFFYFFRKKRNKNLENAIQGCKPSGSVTSLPSVRRPQNAPFPPAPGQYPSASQRTLWSGGKSEKKTRFQFFWVKMSRVSTI